MLADCVVVGVCVFAIAYLIRYTDGPFDIFYRFRKRIGVYLEEWDGDVYSGEVEDPDPDKFLAKLVSCFWCLSTWVSLGVTSLYVILYGDSHIFPFMWLFAIGLSGVLHKVAE